MKPSLASNGIRLKELCSLLAVDYDDARYTLAKGVLPKAIAASEPGRGNHRRFDAESAFYLAVCLKVKAAGVRMELAAEIANWSRKIQGLAQNGGWDFGCAPGAVRLPPQQSCYLDVGDARFVRLVTDASPSRPGLKVLPWTDMTQCRAAPHAQPAVIVRVDMGQIARMLQAPFHEF